MPIDRGAVGVIAHQPSSVGKFQNWVNLVESGNLRYPADHGEAGQIDIVALVTERRSADSLAKSGPEVERIAVTLRDTGS